MSDYNNYYNHVSQQELIHATQALLHFCRTHEDSRKLIEVEHCLENLKQNDIQSALTEFSKVPFGGYGGFDDWFPPAVFSHETTEYVYTVFKALCRHWSENMVNAAGGKEAFSRKYR